jgi:hypothetical protein
MNHPQQSRDVISEPMNAILHWSRQRVATFIELRKNAAAAV